MDYSYPFIEILNRIADFFLLNTGIFNCLRETFLQGLIRFVKLLSFEY